MTHNERDLIEWAARAIGMSVSNFIRTATLDRAAETIAGNDYASEEEGQ